MTQAPATGLWGCPDDYGPNFRTLEYQFSRMAQYRNEQTMGYAKWSPWDIECTQRSAVVTALLDLAHDLDARGVELLSDDERRHIWDQGYFAALTTLPKADADLATGGE